MDGKELETQGSDIDHGAKLLEMEQTLRQSGCRITHQRQSILRLLASTELHPSARQIHEILKREDSKISLATVYNTLRTLVSMGLIKLLDFESRDNRYDVNSGLHINLICNVCGGIEDLESGFPMTPSMVEQQTGFRVADCRLEYYGLCGTCCPDRHDTETETRSEKGKNRSGII